ncbi:IclR family transcriptional regulator C-terminal domain-containing protein [Pseudonocardia sp. MH-G8]|uniref:IclR family transcriptional regulator domain-containing protein n=1 Tax=Pseudonocardia sp. MH-G8 TaxID=1854588 RepID=UPI000BA10992|nr:IclR family transcriptional regulator C-terminal domain-containing protein [Pseudonocardia sp. MH-G8]OZM78089.1 IclR family transcriptional regulator [Pseudonocardia sp. MH-G8]
MSRQDPDFIDSVDKALQVMLVFSAENPELSVSRVAELTGQTRATVRRVLLTFARLGFAEVRDRRFRLTSKVLRLGYGYLSSAPWWEAAEPHMRSLSGELQESSSLATLDGAEIVYLARVPSPRSVAITLNIGSRLPAYPTSLGRALLAALPEDELDAYLESVDLRPLTPHTITDPARLREVLHDVRRDGYALIDGEREVGVRSVAAPIRDRDGVIAALNISVNAARLSVDELRERCAPMVIEHAEAISAEIATR